MTFPRPLNQFIQSRNHSWYALLVFLLFNISQSDPSLSPTSISRYFEPVTIVSSLKLTKLSSNQSSAVRKLKTAKSELKDTIETFNQKNKTTKSAKKSPKKKSHGKTKKGWKNDTHNTTSEDFYNVAATLFSIGQYAEIDGVFQQALAAYPNSSFLYNRFGELYFEVCIAIDGRIDPHQRKTAFFRAKEAFLNATRVDQRHKAAHYNLGRLFMHVGDLFSAEDRFRTAIKLAEAEAAIKLAERAAIKLAEEEESVSGAGIIVTGTEQDEDGVGAIVTGSEITHARYGLATVLIERGKQGRQRENGVQMTESDFYRIMSEAEMMLRSMRSTDTEKEYIGNFGSRSLDYTLKWGAVYVLQGKLKHAESEINGCLAAIQIGIKEGLPEYTAPKFDNTYYDKDRGTMTKIERLEYALFEIEEYRGKNLKEDRDKADISTSSCQNILVEKKANEEKEDSLVYFLACPMEEFEDLLDRIADNIPVHSITEHNNSEVASQISVHRLNIISLFEKRITEYPIDAYLHLKLGRIFSKLQDDSELAEISYKDAITIAPDLAPAHYHLALLLQRTNRKEEAVGALRAAVEGKNYQVNSTLNRNKFILR